MKKTKIGISDGRWTGSDGAHGLGGKTLRAVNYFIFKFFQETLSFIVSNFWIYIFLKNVFRYFTPASSTPELAPRPTSEIEPLPIQNDDFAEKNHDVGEKCEDFAEENWQSDVNGIKAKMMEAVFFALDQFLKKTIFLIIDKNRRIYFY